MDNFFIKCPKQRKNFKQRVASPIANFSFLNAICHTRTPFFLYLRLNALSVASLNLVLVSFRLRRSSKLKYSQMCTKQLSLTSVSFFGNPVRIRDLVNAPIRTAFCGLDIGAIFREIAYKTRMKIKHGKICVTNDQ